jgi:acyl carrier protein
MSTPVETLLAELLGVPEAAITDVTGRANLAEWTSLAHIQVVTAIEEEYRVTLSSREIAEAASVGQLRAVLLAKGVRA